MNQNIITINSVGQRFGEVIALDNINMNIKKGEIIAFSGQEFSQPSTQAMIRAGVLPDARGIAQTPGVTRPPRPMCPVVAWPETGMP